MREIEALVALYHVPGIGAVRIRQLVEFFGSAVEVLDSDVETLCRAPGIGKAAAGKISGARDGMNWQQDLKLANESGVEIISMWDERYPRSLWDLSSPPVLLYVKGDLPSDLGIAVIGTRNATVYGRSQAETLARDLASSGLAVISGLARGIDTAAHVGALQGGTTVAVIGSGLAHIYPQENRELASRIGCVISEYPMRLPPDRHHFPQRNRIVAGLSKGILLIEAPRKSGGMLTMELGEQMGKDLFAIPGRVDSENFKGNHLLLKERRAQLVEQVDDVLEYYGDRFQGRPVGSSPVLDPEEQALFDQLPEEEISIEEILLKVKLPVTKLNVLLMSLLMKKAIREFPGKLFRKAS